VVPPSGQFAKFNAIAEPFRRLLLLQAGHFGHPGQAQEWQQMNEEITRIFRES
jgi:hypothetical protein